MDAPRTIPYPRFMRMVGPEDHDPASAWIDDWACQDCGDRPTLTFAMEYDSITVTEGPLYLSGDYARLLQIERAVCPQCHGEIIYEIRGVSVATGPLDWPTNVT